MTRTRVDQFAATVEPSVVKSVRSASAAKTASRVKVLHEIFEDPEAAQESAAAIKEFVLDHLKELLLQLESNCKQNGVQVHWAADASQANAIITEICLKHASEQKVVVKGKSMATEEIHLNEALEQAGLNPVETDLGEFVVQLDHDHPSHIVTPIIHKNRHEIGLAFEREGVGPFTEVPEQLAAMARKRLRSYFQSAGVGISGVNFAIAETGQLVIVENEGNNRFSTTAPRVHIAVMGIEKILPSLRELPLFLQLLAGSATGQKLTTYVHMIQSPRQKDELDGPEKVHLVLLDNGRTGVLGGDYRSILRCIRCGACLNVCPVYRASTGHGYHHVYPGPLGAVLAPALEGVDRHGELAKASSLCGACEEVCPVKIPIPQMLLHLRQQYFTEVNHSDSKLWGGFSMGATRPVLWRAGLKLLPMAKLAPITMVSGWQKSRSLPRREGRSFREWWNGR